MTSYILRRLLLIIPTLFGIILINFFLIQFVPGGPIEQILAELQGKNNVFESIAGGSENNDLNNDFQSNQSNSFSEKYIGARGLPDDFIIELEKQFGFDKPPIERFFKMIWSYICFDFGESYFRSISVFDLVIEKLPVSISLGLWTTLLAYFISIPLGIKKQLMMVVDLIHGLWCNNSWLCNTRIFICNSSSCFIFGWFLSSNIPN